ncbi:hypothetical protein ACLB2K_020616 [Fragaria x ananassa]
MFLGISAASPFPSPVSIGRASRRLSPAASSTPPCQICQIPLCPPLLVTSHHRLSTGAEFYFDKLSLFRMPTMSLHIPRYEIVNSVTEVEGVDPESAVDQGDNATKEKGVPDFWLTAMKNNEVLSEEISERDEGALKYLKDIKWSRIDEPKGFKLDFFFNANPYFKNSIRTKTYHMIDDDEPILEKAIG